MTRPSLALTVGALTLTMLSACGDSGGEEKPDSAIPGAAEACDPAAINEDLLITYDYSDDHVMVRSSESSMEAQLTVVATVGCLVKELDGPSSIGERYLSGSDGSESWDGYEANWVIEHSALFTIDAK